jgi:hypothetical protein
MRIVVVTTCALIVGLSITVTLHAQSITRPATILRDSGDLSQSGGAGNRKRIKMRVWVERMTHSDDTATFSLNYSLAAEDARTFGGWRPEPALHSITYTLEYGPPDDPRLHTRSGTIRLNNLSTSSEILFDGLAATEMVVGTLTATGQRSGGARGIAVRF